ncbi:MAG: helix-turn-helix domain-containing protein [Deltaproteobacteria bacterium]|nr:helix-turn-helix domain-containing protein [Deltaproteobacteria bacterium]
MELEQPMTLGEAAKRYVKSPKTLRDAIDRGELLAHRVGDGPYDVFASDVVRWIRANPVLSAAERVQKRGEED